MKNTDVVTTSLTSLLTIIVVDGILSYFIMLLWNGCLMPAINGVNPISWLQALGLLILCGLLFKSPSYSKSNR